MIKNRPLLLVFSNNYPDEKSTYSSNFIHNRVKSYLANFQCIILKQTTEASYVIQGISVITYTNESEVKSIIRNYSPNLILIHFINRWLITKILPGMTIPIIVWVHGVEALGWYRRLFNYSLSDVLTLVFYRRIRQNFLQLWNLRKIIKISNSQLQHIHFVFVSNWMKRTCELDTFIRCRNFSIIPNPIDTRLFEYKPKAGELRTKILLLRSFESRKYANDIAIAALIKLSRKDYFKSLQITIIGSGRYFDKLTDKLSSFSNVKIIKSYIHNNAIPEIHDLNGIFLCPTRQDAQGVSMCEAMSSGLVPVTSYNTAIPEFVKHKNTGLLTKSSNSIVDSIEYLYRNEEEFTKISNRAAKYIKTCLSNEIINPKEIAIINKHLNIILS